MLVLIDTLRVDRLGLRGAAPSPSPWIDGLAETAAVFDRAWSSSSWTAPSTATVFTGLYPTQHGVIRGLVATQALEQAAAQGGRGSPRSTASPRACAPCPSACRPPATAPSAWPATSTSARTSASPGASTASSTRPRRRRAGPGHHRRAVEPGAP
ncbi:MAG: sulfatase-like hydrolase/transferase [Alphaproteobacteria bacterium]|nr:sulfatase-like hydrolase/transferase [Alphaproteobacteria bacterium]